MDGKNYFKTKNEEEFCFNQYFEIVSEIKLRLDKIDSILGCICFRWHRTAVEKGIFSPAPEFEFEPIDAIRGCVDIVQRGTAILVIDKSDAKAVTDHSVCD